CLSCPWDMPVAFRPSLVFSAWPEARLIGGMLPGAMHSVLVTSCTPTLVLWDTLRVVYKEKQVVFKVSTSALCDLVSRVYHGNMYNISMHMWKSPPKDSACESVESILYSEDITMKRLIHIISMWSAVPLLGLVLLAQPQPAR